MSIDLLDVRVLAELSEKVDRLQHLRDDFRWQRDVYRDEHAEPEREAYGQRQDVGTQPTQAESFCQPGSPIQKQLALLTPDRYGRHDRHVGLDRGLDVAHATVEVDDIMGQGWSVGCVNSAGKVQHDAARSQCRDGVLFPGVDQTDT